MKREFNTIAIVGGGAWGLCFGTLLSHKFDQRRSLERIRVYVHDERKRGLLIRERRLPALEWPLPFPERLSFPSSVAEAVNDADLVVIAVPGKYLQEILKELPKQILKRDTAFLSLVKTLDFDDETGMLQRPSQIISQVCDVSLDRIAVLSGPTLAGELASNFFDGLFRSYQPTHAEIACSDKILAEELKRLVSIRRYFEAYVTTDVVGVELCAALKNVLALGAGMLSAAFGCYENRTGNIKSVGFKYNFLGSYIQFGMMEMATFITENGGRPETAFGISGLGDLVTTCFSFESRNNTQGKLISIEHLQRNPGELRDHQLPKPEQFQQLLQKAVDQYKSQLTGKVPEALTTSVKLARFLKRHKRDQGYFLISEIGRCVEGDSNAFQSSHRFIQEIQTFESDFIGVRIDELFKSKYLPRKAFLRNISLVVCGITLAVAGVYVATKGDGTIKKAGLATVLLGVYTTAVMVWSKSVYMDFFERIKEAFRIFKQ